MLFDAEFGMWRAKADLLTSFQPKDGIVVLGDSRIVAAYMPTKARSRHVVNMGLGGGTPIEAYYILRKLMNSKSGIRKILISFSPTHFEDATMFLGRTMVFEFLTEVEVSEVLEEMKYKQILGHEPSDYLYCQYKFPQCYKSYYKNLISLNLRPKNLAIYKETLKSNGWHLFGTKTPNSMPGEVGKSAFILNKTVDYYFEKLIELAEKNNIEITYYSTPLSRSAYENIDRSYRKQYFDYLKGKSVKMRVIDGGWLPLDCIGDGSHVNNKGAEIVTDYIDRSVFGKNLH